MQRQLSPPPASADGGTTTEFHWTLFFAPALPTGIYRVQAQQGGLIATGSLQVVRPRRPSISVSPRRVRVGDSIDVLLMAFPRRKQRLLFYYRRSRQDVARFVGWTVVRLDRRGDGVAHFRVTRRDRPGRYWVIDRPPRYRGQPLLALNNPAFIVGRAR